MKPSDYMGKLLPVCFSVSHEHRGTWRWRS